MTEQNNPLWGRSVWGIPPEQYPHYFKQLAAENYSAVEVGVPENPDDCEYLRQLANDNGLKIIAQQWTQGTNDLSQIDSFQRQLDIALKLDPIFINSHTGKDWFPLQKNVEIIRAADSYAAAHDIPLLHETHRGRATFSLPQTIQLLDSIPSMRLCLDLSHWCCVHESLLEDQSDALLRAMTRADYLHLRVGHTQGSQISALDSELWQSEISTHLGYWNQWIEIRKSSQLPIIMSPEFGPEPYLTQNPDKAQPLRTMEHLNQQIRAIVTKNATRS